MRDIFRHMNTKAFRLGLVVVIVVLAGGIYLFNRGHEATSPKSEEERQKLLAVSDLDTLKNRDSALRDASSSLIRLAAGFNPMAKERALEWSKSPNKDQKLAAAEALGLIFDQDAQTALLELEKSEDPALVARMAKGVSHRPDEDRVQWMKRLEAKFSQSSEARLEILSGLIKIDLESKSKDTYLGELIKMARTSKDLELSAKAYSRALGQGPRHPEVIKLIHDRIDSSKDVQEKAMSLRHLALIQDPKSLEVFEKFAKDPAPELRRAALQVIPNICPEKRWIVLNDIIKTERDRSVVSVALEVPKMLNESNSKDTYNDWLKIGDLSESEKEVIRAHIQSLEAKTQESAPCNKGTL